MDVTALKIIKILWKPYCGSYVQAQLGVIFLKIYVLGKLPITDLTAGP